MHSKAFDSEDEEENGGFITDSFAMSVTPHAQCEEENVNGESVACTTTASKTTTKTGNCLTVSAP